MLRNALIVCVVMTACAAGGWAAMETFNGTAVDVDYWAGSGANKAIVVVDFGVGNVSKAFGYQWSGEAWAWDAIEAISAAGALDVDASTHPTLGHYINSFSYPGATGTASSWSHYMSDDGGAWSSCWDGVDSRLLTNGAWDGWSLGEWYQPDPVAAPEWWEHDHAPVTPVPEPVTLSLMLAGCAALVCRKQGRTA